MRPPSIVKFERLYILKIVIGVIAGFWTMTIMSSVIMPPNAPAAVKAFAPLMTVGSVLFSLAISLLLLFFIARRGSEVAKWIFIVLFTLGAAGTLKTYVTGDAVMKLPLGLSMVALVQLLVEIAMVVLLFRPDAKVWFR